jgi:hypothetical protein
MNFRSFIKLGYSKENFIEPKKPEISTTSGFFILGGGYWNIIQPVYPGFENSK